MLRLIVKNLLIVSLLLFLSAILRGALLWANFDSFTEEPDGLLRTAFVHGMRFDLSAILYINTLFFMALPVERVRNHFLTKWIFALTNLFYLVLCMGDISYFAAYGKKLDMNFMAAISGTGKSALFQMLSANLIYAVLLGLLFVSFIFIYKWIYEDEKICFKGVKSYVQYGLIALPLIFLGIRGGLQKRVLGSQHTLLYAAGSSNISHLTSNTVHNLIRGKKSFGFPKEFTPVGASEPVKNLNWSDLEGRPPQNIVVIFIESFSSYMAKDQNSAFNRMRLEKPDEVIFNNSLFSNGALSMDALTSVLLGVPSYFDMHLFRTKYVENKFIGLPNVLKEKGFTSFFIDGGEKGTQFFDVIAGASGVENFYSVRDEYDAPSDQVGTWGVHDKFFYEKSKEIIGKQKPPFFGALFTTSSHTPFKGTPNNPDGMGDIEQDYLAAVKYADNEVYEFLKSVEMEPWFKETLFVVTGDHSPPLNVNWNRNPEYRFRLPLLLYFPGSKLGKLPVKKNLQHIDLPISFFHLLGFKPSKWSAYGSSIFDFSLQEPILYTSRRGRFNVVLNSGVLEVDYTKKKEGEMSFYDFSSQSYLGNHQNIEGAPMAVEQAYIRFQDYIYRLQENKL